MSDESSDSDSDIEIESDSSVDLSNFLLITNANISCSECKLANKPYYNLKSYAILCSSCDTSQIIIQHNNLSTQHKYQCNMCLNITMGAKFYNGYIFCRFCNGRAARFVVGEEFCHSPCINKQYKCDNNNCNYCFHLRYTDLSNRVKARIITNHSITTKSYADFLIEYSSKLQQSFADFNPTQLEKFNRTLYYMKNSEDIMAQLEKDIISINPNTKRNALMIWLTLLFNLRSVISKNQPAKKTSIGLINLQKHHLYLDEGNLVTMVFPRKRKVIINITQKLDNKLYSALSDLIKDKQSTDFLFLELNNADFNNTLTISINSYFKEITKKATGRLRDTKQMITNNLLYRHLKIIYKQNYPKSIIVTKTQRLIAYLAVLNDHDVESNHYKCVLQNYIDARLLFGFLKATNIHPMQVMAMFVCESLLWGAGYVEDQQKNIFLHFSDFNF